MLAPEECIMSVKSIVTNLKVEPGWVGEIACNLGKLVYRDLRQFIVVDNGPTARRFVFNDVA